MLNLKDAVILGGTIFSVENPGEMRLGVNPEDVKVCYVQHNHEMWFDEYKHLYVRYFGQSGTIYFPYGNAKCERAFFFCLDDEGASTWKLIAQMIASSVDGSNFTSDCIGWLEGQEFKYAYAEEGVGYFKHKYGIMAEAYLLNLKLEGDEGPVRTLVVVHSMQ